MSDLDVMPLCLDQHCERGRRVVVVVCDEDAQTSACGAGFRCRGRFWLRGGGPAERQADRESAACPRSVTLGIDLATVHLGQAAHERQADSEPAFGLPLVRAHLGEPIEYVRQLISRDSDAAVGNRTSASSPSRWTPG